MLASLEESSGVLSSLEESSGVLSSLELEDSLLEVSLLESELESGRELSSEELELLEEELLKLLDELLEVSPPQPASAPRATTRTRDMAISAKILRFIVCISLSPRVFLFLILERKRSSGEGCAAFRFSVSDVL